MDDLLHNFYFSGFFSSGDWPTILLFLGMGLVYFLVPAAGYTLANRVRIALGMWVLVGKFGLSLIRISLWTTQLMDRPRVSGLDWYSSTVGLGMMFLPILETSAVILAMALFIYGLQGLKRKGDQPPPRFGPE
jgi:hypothetical protein